MISNFNERTLGSYHELRKATKRILGSVTNFSDREVDIIFRDVLGIDKLDMLLGNLEGRSFFNDVETVRGIVEKRLSRMPLQYIIGKTYFRKLELIVGKGVLIPRPETELLVDWAMEEIKRQLQTKDALTILDMGTGSGAISAAIASEFIALKNAGEVCGNLRIDAVDISSAALRIAEQNLKIYDFVSLIQGDMFENIDSTYDVVVSNPPYIAERERDFLEPEVLEYEPSVALFAGDGLDFYRRFCRELPHYLRSNASFVFELGAGQYDEVATIVRDVFDRESEYILDYAKRRRFICLTDLA